MAPTSVFLSSGSPSRSVDSRRFSDSSTSSWTFSCTSSREPAQQTWPWLKKMPLTMPSTAWSIGASSKTMLAALPPSSRVTFFFVPAVERAIILPTSVEPVNATLLTSACSTSARPVSPAPVTMLTTPGGQVGLLADLGEQQRGERRGLRGLEHDGVARGERRRDLPGQHQQREVPRDDLPGHAERLGVRPEAGVVELVGPARVVEEPCAATAGCRRRATRGSACRCRATRARPARGRAPAGCARCGRGTCRARAPASSTTPGCTRGARPAPRGRRRPDLRR